MFRLQVDFPMRAYVLVFEQRTVTNFAKWYKIVIAHAVENFFCSFDNGMGLVGALSFAISLVADAAIGLHAMCGIRR